LYIFTGKRALSYNGLNDKGDHHAALIFQPEILRAAVRRAPGDARRSGRGTIGTIGSIGPVGPSDAQRIEPGSDVPATNIPPKRGTEIVEHRNGGQVTEVEVTAGGSHYSMKPNNQPGNAQTNSIRAPQWKVGEFDLSGKRRAGNEAGQNTPTTADAPPPPMPAAAGPANK
jgi:hypothetical protein